MTFMPSLTIGLGQRPHQSLKVVTRDGGTFDLGPQVEGTDLVARFYQWRQERRIAAYIRDRLASLTGPERDEFMTLMEKPNG